MRTLTLATLALSTAILAPAADAPKDVADTLKQLEKKMADAGVKRDAKVIEDLEAADFVSIYPDGAVVDRKADVGSITSGDFTAQAINVDDMKVRTYGNVAVITGRSVLKGAKYKKDDISGEYRFTDVWVKSGGAWKIVSSQGTAVAKK